VLRVHTCVRWSALRRETREGKEEELTEGSDVEERTRPEGKLELGLAGEGVMAAGCARQREMRRGKPAN
jgi:hypothetical protein